MWTEGRKSEFYIDFFLNQKVCKKSREMIQTHIWLTFFIRVIQKNRTVKNLKENKESLDFQELE